MIFDLNTSSRIKAYAEKLDLKSDLIRSEVAKLLNDIADKALEEVVLRVPFLTGALQNSVDAEHANINDLTSSVYISANAPAGKYALKMHEAFYNLGEKSIQKQTKTGVQVGRKYMDRALQENEDKFALYFLEGIREFLK